MGGIQLSEQVVITADAPLAYPVALTQDAWLDLTQTDPGDGASRSNAMQVSGGDEQRYTGVLLTDVGRTDGFAALMLEPPLSADAPRGIVSHGQPHVSDRQDPGAASVLFQDLPACELCRVPAGEYELVVVAFAPVTITLALDGAPEGITEIATTDGHPVGPLAGELHFASGRTGGDQGASSVELGVERTIFNGSSSGWLVQHWDISVQPTEPGTAVTTG